MRGVHQLQRKQKGRRLHHPRRERQARAAKQVVRHLAHGRGGGVQNPRPVRQLGQRQVGGAAQRVVLPAHHMQRLGGQVLVVELAALVLGGEAANHQVDLALGQPGDELVAALLQDLDDQEGPQALDLDHRRHQHMRSRAGDGAHRHMAVTALLERVELVDKLALPIERRAGVAQRKKPQLVGPHAAREAVEQARLQDLLDVHQDLGRRRLRDVHLLGREPQVARAAQDVQKLQMPKAQPRAGLRQRQGFTRKFVWTHKRLEWIVAKHSVDPPGRET